MSHHFEELGPQNFSFNSPLGWCPACEGLGTERGTNQSLLIANPQATLAEGCVAAWPMPKQNRLFQAILEGLHAEFGLPLDVPWSQLEARYQRLVLYGTGNRACSVCDPHTGCTFSLHYKGLYPAIEEAARISFPYRLQLQDLVGEKPCSVCNGDRIRADAAAVRLQDVTLPQLTRRPLNEVLEYLTALQLSPQQQKIAGDLLNEVIHRLRFLIDVGLHYLTLDRGMPTLSGGESQRIRLAGQIGRALTGVLYVLDEPTIGLHPRDNGRLIQALHRLRDLGNTVVLVEHDREVLEASDRLYDFGPGSGRFGGTIVAEGSPLEIERETDRSLTGAYLSGKRTIPVPRRRRMQHVRKGPLSDRAPDVNAYQPPPGGAWLMLTGCRLNNLQGVTLRIPLGTLTCVTGLSGSGKSSLIQETLSRAVARHLQRGGAMPGPYDELMGVEQISRVITVDQQPLGATPASNPATYTGVFDPIRDLFSRLPEAKIRGFKPGRFSFNRAGGRCDDCEGLGQRKIEMHFLPDVWVTCETCHGKRYNQETLAVQYKGHSIADVLDMSIAQAWELFQNIPKIRAPLATLDAIGLGYLTLGQSATTLSGGEAQRVKLAAELCKPNSGRTLYLLDEPTTGLHFDDIAKLLTVLGSLVEQGNTVVVIEHNLDVIKTADWIVDLGPEAGSAGGWIVAEGTPEDVVAQAKRYHAQNKRKNSRKNSALNHSAPPTFRSWTGELLEPVLKNHQRGDLELFDTAAVAKKQKGDIDIAHVGKQTAPPWQIDGRKWHTQQRLARNGKPCRWEGSALALVVDWLAEYDGLKEPNWSDPARVEVTAKAKTGTGWFFHALTGDEWLLRLYFRVPKGTFQEADLQRRLKLRSVNELDELPIYNRAERVRTNQSKGPFQEVILDVHWQEEIDTPAFRTFLKQAVEAYLGRVQQQPADVHSLMPWVKLGRKWHLSRKGFASNRRVQWEGAVLEKLFALVEDTFPNLQPDWSNKVFVPYASQDGRRRAEIVTKKRECVELALLTEPGSVALGRIAHLGASREIVPHRSGGEAVKLSFDAVAQVEDPQLREFLEQMQMT